MSKKVPNWAIVFMTILHMIFNIAFALVFPICFAMNVPFLTMLSIATFIIVGKMDLELWLYRCSPED